MDNPGISKLKKVRHDFVPNSNFTALWVWVALLIEVSVALSVFELNVFANEEAVEQPSRFRIMNFGVAERFTTQSTFSGVNLSTLLSWNPHFQLAPWLNLEGQIGGTGMISNLGDFIAARYQLGVSFHDLFAGEDLFVPEVLFGAETWAVRGGGTYFATSLNFHYRFHFVDSGILNILDSIHLGFQWLPGAPASAQQYTAGVRLVPFPEKRIQSEPEVAKIEPKEVLAPTPAPILEPPVAESAPKDIQKGAVAEVLPDGVRVTLPVSRVSFQTGYAELDMDGLEFARGFGMILSLVQKNWDRIEIVGHTDKRGNENSNKKLSLARAKSLEAELKAAGIDPKMLSSVGAGSSEPRGPGDNEAAWKANRRVVVRVYGKQDGSALAQSINEFDAKN